MSTTALTKDTFEDTVIGDGIVLVDWWASWCGPCMSFAPVFEEASERHADVTFAKVDTEAEQELAGAAGIQSIPTLMAFRDGILLFSQAGALPAHVLDDLLDKVREVDMAEVRASVEESAAASAEG